MRQAKIHIKAVSSVAPALATLAVVGWLLSPTAWAQELPDFTALVEQNSPAVVNISTTNKSLTDNPSAKNDSPSDSPNTPQQIPGIPDDSPFHDFFRRFFDEENRNNSFDDEERRESTSLGSGFIISPDGYIATNNHVIEGADEIIVLLSDRRELEAKLIGADKRSDIALLKVEANNLPVVKLGSSANLKVGEWVLAIGSPFGFDHSVTAGIVSAKGRSLPESNSNYVPFIQTDVAINPGNSGGPLFNLQGEVVGVNAQIFSRTGGFMGLSFSIPIDIANNIINQLKEKGTVSRGWLGVLIQDVTGELAESFKIDKPRGALIAKIFDGPGKDAGLEIGDVIVTFNGQPIKRSSELPPIVGSTEVGSTVDVLIIRQGKEITLKLKVGELPSEDELDASTTPSGKHTEKAHALALTVEDMDKETRQKLDVAEGGALVHRVDKGPAKEAGIRPGDVLLMLNGEKIKDAAHFKELAKDLKPGSAVPVLISRQGSPTFLVIRVAAE